MESGQLRKLNLCYAGIQSLYWAGFAAIWAFLSVLLLYRGFSNSQIGTVSALALLMPLAVQPVLASLRTGTDASPAAVWPWPLTDFCCCAPWGCGAPPGAWW